MVLDAILFCTRNSVKFLFTVEQVWTEQIGYSFVIQLRTPDYTILEKVNLVQQSFIFYVKGSQGCIFMWTLVHSVGYISVNVPSNLYLLHGQA